MHKYESHYFCDGCGKELDDEDRTTIFSNKKNYPITIWKGTSMIDYDFCHDCYIKVKTAMDDILNKENRHG